MIRRDARFRLLVGCACAVMSLAAGAMELPQTHGSLDLNVALGGWGYDSDWKGVSTAFGAVYVRLFCNVGGTVLDISSNGQGKLTCPTTVNQGTLEFQGAANGGNAAQDLGIEVGGKYRIVVGGSTYEGDLPVMPNTDVRLADSKTFTPYQLGNSVTLSDSTSDQDVYTWKIGIPMVFTGNIGVHLSASDSINVNFEDLHTDKADFTADGQRNPVSVPGPTLTVGDIYENIGIDPTMSFTPSVVVGITVLFKTYEIPIPIGTVAVPLKTLLNAEYPTTPSRSVTFPVPPTVMSMAVNSEAPYATTPTVTLNNACSNAPTDYMASEDVGFSGAAWLPYAGAPSFVFRAGDGQKTAYFKTKNASGESPAVSDTITLDTAPPTGSVVINGGAACTSDTDVTLALAHNDGTGSGVAQMRFSDNGTTWSEYEAVGATRAWTVSSGDGTKTVYVQYKDAAGNESSAASDTIMLDANAPTGTLLINGGAAYATVTGATLALTAGDGGGAGGIQMRLSADGTNWSAWEAFAASKPWTLSTGDGLKTAQVQFKDNAGNVSASVLDTIFLDTNAPTGTLLINGGAAYATGTGATLALTAGDGGGAGGIQMRLSADGTNWSAWEAFAASKPWTLSTGDGLKTAQVQFKDSAGNVSASVLDTIFLDTNAPTGTLLINGGAEYATVTGATLTLTASDGGGAGGIQMRLSADGTNWSAWEAFAASKPWTLSTGDGLKTAYAQFKDAAGNGSASFTDSITLDQTVPGVTLATTAGSMTNKAFTVTATFTEAVTGFVADDVAVMNGTVSAFTGSGASYQCTVTPTVDGTVTVNVKSGRCVDVANNGNTASNTLTLTHDATPPTGTVVINGGAANTNRTAVTLALTANDGAGSGVTQMRFSNNGTAWSAYAAVAATKAWDMSPGAGVKTVYVQYKDAAGNQSSAVSDAITLDATPPTAVISLISPAATSSDTVVFSVVFSEAVGTSFNNKTVSFLGTLPGTAAVTGTDPNYTVTVTPTDPNADGTVGISIPGSGVTDLAGNVYGGGHSVLCMVHNWTGMAQPQSTPLYVGGHLTLQVKVDEGGVPTTYLWKHRVGEMTTDGPAAAQWTLTDVGTAQAGAYWCEVLFDGILHKSDMVNLEVQSPISIITPPVGGEVAAGQSYRFSVAASGGYGTLSYQWKKDGADIGGANESEYTLSNLTTGNSASYSVEISDTNGGTIESPPVMLTVLPSVPLAGVGTLALLAGAIVTAVVRRRRQ